MNNPDLNDLQFFAVVVEHGGYAAAERALGIPKSAAVPAEAAGLVVFWPKMGFFHPLVRSAVYQAATAIERRQAHRALAAACDAEFDAVPRAWHLAAAAAGPARRATSRPRRSSRRRSSPTWCRWLPRR